MECKKCKYKKHCVNVGEFKKGACLQYEKLLPNETAEPSAK